MKEELTKSQNCSENLTNANGNTYGKWQTMRNLKKKHLDYWIRLQFYV